MVIDEPFEPHIHFRSVIASGLEYYFTWINFFPYLERQIRNSSMSLSEALEVSPDTTLQFTLFEESDPICTINIKYTGVNDSATIFTICN